MNGALRQIPATFSLLKDRNLRTYLTGHAVSLVGFWMQWTAQSWLVWEMTRSGEALGWVGAFSMAPFFVLGPWTGAVADRVNRKNLLRVCQVAGMLLATALGALIATGTVRIGHVYLLALLSGVVAAFESPTIHAFLGDITGLERVRRAVVINNTVFQLSRMVGPVLAGWAIHSVGLASAFFANAAGFLVALLAIHFVRVAPSTEVNEVRAWTDAFDGLRFVRDRFDIRTLFAFTILMTFFGLSTFQVLSAFVSRELAGDSKTLGLLMGASGVGALAGSMLLVPISHQFSRIGWILGIAGSWTGGWFVAFALSRWLPFSMAALCLGSVTIPVVLVNVTGLVQTLAAPEIRARVLSALLMLTFGAQPLAMYLVGHSVERLGPAAAVALNGALLLAGSSGLLAARARIRGWRLASR